MNKPPPNQRVCLKINGISIACDVASTSEEQRTGLQTYSSLDDGEGLLFPYGRAHTTAFYMGTVSFPIDMVGLRGKAIQAIVSDIQPGTPGYWVFEDITDVLELPGGFCHRHNINLNSQIERIEKQNLNSSNPLRTLTEAETQNENTNENQNVDRTQKNDSKQLYMLTERKKSQISNPQWNNYIEPTIEPGQTLPTQTDTNPLNIQKEKRQTKPHNQYKDRQPPSNFLPNERNFYENYGYSPLNETDVAVRPSAKLQKAAQIILKIHPDLLQNLLQNINTIQPNTFMQQLRNDFEYFKQTPIGQITTKLSELYDKNESQHKINNHWKSLTKDMSIWDTDAIVTGLVTAGYDKAIDLLKVSKLAQEQGEEFRVGGLVALSPRAGETYDGIRSNEMGHVVAVQGPLIAVKFDDYPSIKWIDKLDLNALHPSREEVYQDIVREN